VFEASAVGDQPVRDAVAAGLTPIFPVTADIGVLETPAFARIA
jgi:hypothetical protein